MQEVLSRKFINPMSRVNQAHQRCPQTSETNTNITSPQVLNQCLNMQFLSVHRASVHISSYCRHTNLNLTLDTTHASPVTHNFCDSLFNALVICNPAPSSGAVQGISVEMSLGSLSNYPPKGGVGDKK